MFNIKQDNYPFSILNRKVIITGSKDTLPFKRVCTLRTALFLARELIEIWCNDPIYSGPSADELFSYCLLTRNFGDICSIVDIERDDNDE